VRALVAINGNNAMINFYPPTLCINLSIAFSAALVPRTYRASWPASPLRPPTPIIFISAVELTAASRGDRGHRLCGHRRLTAAATNTPLRADARIVKFSRDSGVQFVQEPADPASAVRSHKPSAAPN